MLKKNFMVVMGVLGVALCTHTAFGQNAPSDRALPSSEKVFAEPRIHIPPIIRVQDTADVHKFYEGQKLETPDHKGVVELISAQMNKKIQEQEKIQGPIPHMTRVAVMYKNRYTPGVYITNRQIVSPQTLPVELSGKEASVEDQQKYAAWTPESINNITSQQMDSAITNMVVNHAKPPLWYQQWEAFADAPGSGALPPMFGG